MATPWNPDYIINSGLPEKSTTVRGIEYLDLTKQIKIGSGGSVFGADYQGIWLGATRFENAPFKVDMAGNCTATSLDISGAIIKYGKTSFTDSTNAGYYISSSGIYFGSASDAAYLKYDISAGSLRLSGGTIISSTFQTDVSPNSRIEIYAANEYYENKIVFYEKLNGTSGEAGWIFSELAAGATHGATTLAAGTDLYLWATGAEETPWSVTPSSSTKIGLHCGSGADRYVQFNQNITFTGSQTVDGVDVSSHAANASAHHSSTSDSLDITPNKVTTNGLKFTKRSGPPGTASSSYEGYVYYDDDEDDLVFCAYESGTGNYKWYKVTASAI